MSNGVEARFNHASIHPPRLSNVGSERRSEKLEKQQVLETDTSVFHGVGLAFDFGWSTMLS